MAPEAGRAAFPRSLLLVGVPLAGVFLVSLFIYLGFPYDKLGDRIKAETQRASAVRISSTGSALSSAPMGTCCCMANAMCCS